jgi:hypothetical protein
MKEPPSGLNQEGLQRGTVEGHWARCLLLFYGLLRGRNCLPGRPFGRILLERRVLTPYLLNGQLFTIEQFPHAAEMHICVQHRT